MNPDRRITMDSIKLETFVLSEKVWENKGEKTVGVMIPSWDRINMFYRCIKRIFEHSDQLTGVKLSLVVCNDGPKQAKEYREAIFSAMAFYWDKSPNIISIHQIIHAEEKMGIGVARATTSRYIVEGLEPDYMLSLDDDSLVRGEGIMVAVDFLNNSKPWVAGISTDAAMFSHGKPDFYPKTTLSGNFSMYKVEVLKAIGDWDPNLRSREEFDLCLRLWLAGYECYCTAKIKCGHKRHQDGGLMDSGFSDIKLMNGYLCDKYPGLIKETKNGNLIRTKKGKEVIAKNNKLLRESYGK
jgi:hypothetical protein